MATQVMGQSSGGGGLFTSSGNMGMALTNDMYDLHDLSKAELAAPQLIMLANVALTGEVNGSCCDYLVGEERQMAELMPVGDNNFSDSDGEGLEESTEMKGEAGGLGSMELTSMELSVAEAQPVFEASSAAPEVYSSTKDLPPETPGAEDKCKNSKSKPFRCKPCQYEAESEEQFVHHIKVHSAKKFFVEESAEKQAKARESGSSTPEEGDFSKGPIRCERCGYNTNRYDHYTAHLKHHTRAGDNERVYKCIICTYTTVSEYHWRKHLRNHFPRKVYTCGKCNYFSDRKNNYVQHVRTHTGERPYKCELCPYSSSQKTHLTRHMRTHSGEKPFKCDQCSYVASNQHEVTRHARQVHNGPKPLNCPHCDYKTADRSNFKKHVELHVNPRQFNCPVCDYAASKKCNLQYHFKSKHPTCPSKTMDVSKVKLKKTKKREADLTDESNVTNEKPEAEQTKAKGEVAGKKNEKPVKVEKKEKKPPSHVPAGHVSTRTRKSATEKREAAVHPGHNVDKACRSKKSKRKLEAEAQGARGPGRREEPAAKKKRKAAESRSPSSPAAARGHGSAERREEKQPPKSCSRRSSKKKALQNKPSKKSKGARKEAARQAAPEGPAPRDAPEAGPAPPAPPQTQTPMELSPPAEPAQEPAHTEVAQEGAAPMEVPPPTEPAQEGAAPMEVPPPTEPAHTKVAQEGAAPMEVPPPTEPAHMEVAQEGAAQTEVPLPTEPAHMEVAQEGAAQTEVPPPTEPAHVEVAQEGAAQMELPLPTEPAHTEVAQEGAAQTEVPLPTEPDHDQEVTPHEPAPAGPEQMEVAVQESAQTEPLHPIEPPLQMEAVPKRSSPRKDSKKEQSPLESELARQEQVLMEVGLVPVRGSHLGKDSASARARSPPPPPPQEEAEGPGHRDGPREGGPEEAGRSPAHLAARKESSSASSSEQNLNVPGSETPDDKYQCDSAATCGKAASTELNAAEKDPGKDPAGEEPLLLPPGGERQAVPQTAPASPPVTAAGSDSQEMDEDEGIHSHDGSDLSDNMSEGSDDSGLHGARPAPQESSTKSPKEALAGKAAEGDFVCIFCDRSFRKEKDYSKHLNRHLVNVYFLEKAAKGQE
ncbi:RE1-silencing transcription factor isoform X2 [Perognathus longimembris pacificus]|uniref:RE1-silencing transcription factor isoform X2 n=1 Tax=Perognathus longimembris pacificus TaxID=214514 RepID=UPI00201994F4|nr:RE1-silencing transcription factor isoform X2 [Perognathus longimembris pacificus]